MIGLSRHNGLPLTGWALFTELAEDALTTGLGSREKRRDYGSRLPQLLGQPNNDNLLMQARIRAAETFSHPPNHLDTLFELQQIDVSRTVTGLQLEISGLYQGQPSTFEVLLDATG